MVGLYNRSMPGATIVDLYSKWKLDSTYFGAGDVLIIQSGIVDCAPRPLGPRARNLVGKLPGLIKAKAIQFLHEHRAAILRKGLYSRRTSPARYRRTLERWLRQALENSHRIYVIKIAPTTESMDGIPQAWLRQSTSTTV